MTYLKILRGDEDAAEPLDASLHVHRETGGKRHPRSGRRVEWGVVTWGHARVSYAELFNSELLQCRVNSIWHWTAAGARAPARDSAIGTLHVQALRGPSNPRAYPTLGHLLIYRGTSLIRNSSPP